MTVLFRTIKRSINLLSQSRWLLPQASSSRELSPDFFGINVASSANPATDVYIIQQLKALGIAHVRLDLRLGDHGQFQERFARTLLDQDFKVLIRLLQKPQDAAQMHESGDVRQRWRGFLESAKTMQHKNLQGFEIGAVPNRKKWSGYRHRDYLAAWKIASEVFDADTALIGPGVSDFEPLHSIALLSEMETIRPPFAHGTNLFVERTRSPEPYDHRVLGKYLAPKLKLNLIKKARVMRLLSQQAGVAQTWCTHTCWNAQRVARWAPAAEVEPLRAAYLIRYLVLAAASGSLERVYWGPLIGYPDGIINDDPKRIAQRIERVAGYHEISSRVEDFDIQDSFLALRFLIQKIAGARFESLTTDSYYKAAFRAESTRISILWSPNHEVRLKDSESGSCFNYRGESIEAPSKIGELPVFYIA
jgi:hypothetical protein